MHILQIHNAYQHRSGEEHVVDAKSDMLFKNGHTVKQWIVQNAELNAIGSVKKAQVALRSMNDRSGTIFNELSCFNI